MIPQILLALAIFGGAWQIQEWRYGAKEAKRAEQQLVDQQLAAKETERRINNVINAQNVAVQRSRNLRIAADGSRTALIGLHDASADALRAAGASLEACLVRATAFSTVFSQCGAEYQKLGEKADRHVSDIQTLIDVAPK